MNRADPIASATLALLYVSQGHRTKAQRVLEEVLTRDPLDGPALALRQRLAIPSHAVLGIAVDEQDITVEWQGAVGPVHAVVFLVRVVGNRVTRRVTSARCEDAFGRWSLRRPWASGSAVGCLGQMTPAGFQPIVTARPVTWA